MGPCACEEACRAAGDIHLEVEPPRVTLKSGYLSLVALNDIRMTKGQGLRAVLRAGRDVVFEKETRFDGVVIANRKVHVKKDSQLSFLPPDQTAPTLTILSPAEIVVGDLSPNIVLKYADDFSGNRPRKPHRRSRQSGDYGKLRDHRPRRHVRFP